jgi:hypothetical protein
MRDLQKEKLTGQTLLDEFIAEDTMNQMTEGLDLYKYELENGAYINFTKSPNESYDEFRKRFEAQIKWEESKQYYKRSI